MNEKSPYAKRAAWIIILLVALIGFVQYLGLEIDIYRSRQSFINFTSENRALKEKELRKGLVHLLRAHHFEVDPKEISIKRESGVTMAQAAASREGKILFFTIERRVEFIAAPFFDSP